MSGAGSSAGSSGAAGTDAAGGRGGGVLDLFRLDGRVAVVTGASSGLGARFARALAEAGADVVLAARRVERLREVAASVAEATGRRTLAVETDIADPDACAALADAAFAEFGRLDILVNNAGVGTAVPALRERPDDFRRVIDINLNGSYWAAQACARHMGPASSIINISSVLGLVKSYVPQAAYSASKAGLIGLTRDLAQQWSGRKGIRVNAIAPGYFETELTADVPREPLLTFIGTTGILGRLGEPHELDAAVVFLAGPGASYITGATLAVDGGMSGH
ncbi:putative 2-keto-3-deoxy-D-gluconate dehydrogenase [Frankia sp. AiPs1]|uniref:SDR family NAD(P)-dependent oxidoreductase n=1 Tax=Frankia sp. AiPa1 TaxID=573492 RepID=UPI00202AF85B|nr:SDR family oxidoreductase [Frankia sp. AiPa1]MCL9758184.1 SDR family oxidoreductase [Frankia sp. AiPa1]